MESLLFILSQAPEKAIAQEALDAVMTAVLFEQDPCVIFIGAGVKQLEQQSLKQKIVQLTELGLTKIYINETHQNQASELSIETGISLTTISNKKTTTLLHHAKKILSF